MIRFQEVSYTYLSQGSEEVQSPSLDHISFHIPKGQCVVLCGKSGCGKTTLLRDIARQLADAGVRTAVAHY